MTLFKPDYAAIFGAWPSPAAILDSELRYVACNGAYETVSYHRFEDLFGKALFEVFPGGDGGQQDALAQSFRHVLHTMRPHHLSSTRYDFSARDGRNVERIWTVSNIPLFSPSGDLAGILHCPLDITRLSKGDQYQAAQPAKTDEALVVRAAQSVLNSESARLQELFHQAPGFICVLEGPRHVYSLANDAYYQLVGHREIIGHELADVLPEVVSQGFLSKLDRVFQTGEPFIGRAMHIELQRIPEAPLETRYIDLIYQPILSASRDVTGIFVQGHDVTEAYTLAQEVAFQAAHDALTGLLNRREFARRIGQVEGQGPHALLYMDLDHFKIVNDRCGHAAGDSLLKTVSDVLAMRAGTEAVLARLGGDEFAILLPNCGSDAAVTLAHQMRQAVRAINFIWNGRRYGVTLSVGVATFGELQENTIDDALGHADAACFLAKEAGRDRVKLALPSDDELRRQLTEMDNVTRLKEAIREDRIMLFAQRIDPIVPAKGADITRFEILCRLRDTEGTVVPPSGFIPAAERFGMIEALDRHIVAKAFGHFSSLPTEVRARVGFFINLSGITLGAPGFLSYIERLLEDMPNVNAARICFEVTETAAISDIRGSAAAMRGLAAYGFRFALDDFGSGMATFAYLQQLPVQFVKIEGDFVRASPTNEASRIIVESVARLAACMKMEVIAEAVETSEILEALRPLGVQYTDRDTRCTGLKILTARYARA
ncbi:EAL domain-containing protein [Arsenicitalea aurantiaca]|uniref:EAL domain-containing protein n=1 Tax=Arsenicitalea aurantiaca TaxID=1783274 RepID=A0A433X763_9HYPH|nr:EAL domain-containing protein [Arsenicitalea aurantiaca]RUT29936.1 EAL domain-containing protein [Arsenicitalea aurantiaca]